MKEVRVEGLIKRFGAVTAVDGVSFSVRQGEFVTLLGPSGCGKTTTLNMIAGFERPDGGEIYVGNRLISSDTQHVLVPPHRRNLGMVFQSYGLWPHLSVMENVAYGLRSRGFAKDKIVKLVHDALALVQLDGFADRYPAQLSGGQQQRVAFARAVVYRPDVLLLDEPLSNLDAALREQMRLELKELQKETGITTIFVTHDQLEAMVMSDRIIVMNQGCIEQIGSPSDIYERPVNRFVAGFIGLTNFLEGTVTEATKSDGFGSVRVGKRIWRAQLSGQSVGEEVLLSIRPEDWRVARENPGDATPNLLVVPVEKLVYMGGSKELWLGEHGDLIRVHGAQLPVTERGERLYCWAPPEAVRIIPKLEE